MAEHESSEDTKGRSGGQLGSDIIDVLMRGLDTAKRSLAERGDSTQPDLWCTLGYKDDNHFCPIFYWSREQPK
jgi:hypothetical protein